MFAQLIFSRALTNHPYPANSANSILRFTLDQDTKTSTISEGDAPSTMEGNRGITATSNEVCYVLNPALRFLEYQGRRYGFMARQPHPLCYSSTNGPGESLLRRFDGTTPTAEIAAISRDQRSFSGLVRGLNRNGVLLQSGAGERSERTPQPPPQTDVFHVFPTTLCNLRCIYCYACGGETQPLVVSMDHVHAAMDYFFATQSGHVSHVSLGFHGGGEPTVAFDVLRRTVARFQKLAKKHRKTLERVHIARTISRHSGSA